MIGNYVRWHGILCKIEHVFYIDMVIRKVGTKKKFLVPIMSCDPTHFRDPSCGVNEVPNC